MVAIDGGVVEGEAAAIWVPIDKLIPWVKNPRRIKPGEVAELVDSIQRHGFGAPLIARKENGEICAGHKRILAARKIGMNLIPVRYLDLTEDEAHAYAIADNRLTEVTAWNNETLGEILGDLQSRGVSTKGMGFKPADLHRIIRATQGAIADDDVPDAGRDEDAITKPGDVITLGDHRLVCGDSRETSIVALVMDGAQADFVWTDPPYGIEIVGGNRSISTKERKASGGKTIENDGVDEEKLFALLRATLGSAYEHSRAGAVWYVASPPGDRMFVFASVLRDLKTWRHSIIWSKDAAVLGRQDYPYRHEQIFYGWKPGAGHHAQTDRTQNSVWEIPRPKKSPEHPTMKPVELVARAIRNSSAPGEIVLDVFGGSGTTLIACEHENRRARLVELSPAYCDVIVQRWEQFTGKKATRTRARDV